MDHLPTRPPTPHRPPSLFGSYHVRDFGLRLPYIENFSEYPIACYFLGIRGVSPGDTSGSSAAQFYDYAHIQAWLYFALIRDIFGPATRFEDFLGCDDYSNSRIDSSALQQYVSRWQREHSSRSVTSKLQCLEKIVTSIRAASRGCTMIDEQAMDFELGHMLILFSVRILVSTIWDMLPSTELRDAELHRDDHFSIDHTVWPAFPPSYRPIATMIMEYGWCSHETLRLLGTYSVCTIWCILRAQDRARPISEHQKCFDAPKCIARTIDPIHYQPLHLHDDCDCAPVGPDMSQISAVLEEGEIPLVRCSMDKQNGFKFTVIRAKKPKRHIAISHVWADGVVIPTQNKVNKCQFANLWRHLQTAWPEIQTERKSLLPPSMASFLARHSRTKKTFDIWFDIFCIPTAKDARSIALRKNAIGKIYPIFAGAECVLVIDRGLTRLDYGRLSTIDIMASISLSAWMSRCWTFSEASLAVRSLLLYCIGDQVVRHYDLGVDEYSQPFNALDVISQGVFRNIYEQCLIPFSVAWMASQPVISDLTSFVFVWNHMTSRTTSWPDDIWGIMGTLLGFSGSEIMALEESERLPALLKSTLDEHAIPGSFLFRNMRRCQSGLPSRRWIPQSVETTIRTSDSLLPYHDGGIVLSDATQARFFIKASTFPHQKFSVKISMEGVPQSFSLQISIHDYDTFRRHVRAEKEICIVLLWKLQAGGGLYSDISGLRGIGCCLEVIQSESASMIETAFLSSVSASATWTDSPCDYNVALVGTPVRIKCDDENWYSLKTRRQKHKFKPWTISRVLYFVIPTIYFTLYAIILIPLWIWYRRDHFPPLLLGTGLALLPFVAYMSIVLFHEGFLLQNWFESFMPREELVPWWKKIMPLW